MKIQVSNTQKDLPLDKQSVKQVVQAVLSHLKADPEEVGLYFVSRKKICQLHDAFFQDPTPTDCISFPIDKVHLGEIFVCPSVAKEYAAQKSLDPYQETTLYVIHGLLHLLGYDDLEEKARRTMRKKEKSCMQHLSELGIWIQPLLERT